jgi:hypothetical protein
MMEHDEEYPSEEDDENSGCICIEVPCIDTDCKCSCHDYQDDFTEGD